MKKKGKFDYILLETTGLADPGPIASLFWLDSELCSDIHLDGELCNDLFLSMFTEQYIFFRNNNSYRC